MGNATFNERVVPVLRPDPDRPGATVDHDSTLAGAVEPRQRAPETGFALAGGPKQEDVTRA